MHAFTLPENAKVFGALKPATDAAGRTGRYFNVAQAHKVYFVFEIDQGNAATITVDVLQATNNAGAGAKVFTGVRRYWADLDEATSDTILRQTDALQFTTDAAVKEKLIIVEVAPSDLDQANGFNYVAPRTGASNVANLTSCIAVIVPRYQGANTAMGSFTA
jgi:hypothetical protein